MPDTSILSYLMPGSGNFNSGQSSSNTNTSTTKKYFNPQAIIDQLNRYSQRLGGTSALNNQLLYGKSGAPSAGPYTVPAPSAPTGGAPPATPYFSPKKRVAPATTPPPAGAAPAPAAPPVVPPGGGGSGGGAVQPGNGPTRSPDQPTYTPGLMNSKFSLPDGTTSDAPPPTPVTHGETPAASQTNQPGTTVRTLPDGSVEADLPPLGGTTTTHPAVQVGPGGGTPGGPNGPADPNLPTSPPRRPVGPAGPEGPPVDPNAPPPDPNAPPGADDGSGGLMGLIQQLIGGGGYSEAEKQAIAEKAAAVTQAQKGSAQGQLASHLASSGNAAGYSGAMASLDNSASQTASDQARQNTIDFANEQERRKELGANVMQQLYGINTAADLGYNAQNAGLAGLDGGTDTSGHQSGSFNNQGFNATPDSSANTPSTAKPGSGGGSPGGSTGATTPGKVTPGAPPGSTPSKAGDPPGSYRDKDGNLMVPGPSGILPGGEETPGTDANGNKPGEPGYDPKTDPGTTDANGNHPGDPGFDPNGPLYDPTGIPIQTPDEPPDGGEEPPPDGVPDPPPYDDPGGGDGYDPGGGGGEDLKYNPLAALRRMMAM